MNVRAQSRRAQRTLARWRQNLEGTLPASVTLNCLAVSATSLWGRPVYMYRYSTENTGRRARVPCRCRRLGSTPLEGSSRAFRPSCRLGLRAACTTGAGCRRGRDDSPCSGNRPLTAAVRCKRPSALDRERGRVVWLGLWRAAQRLGGARGFRSPAAKAVSLEQLNSASGAVSGQVREVEASAAGRGFCASRCGRRLCRAIAGGCGPKWCGSRGR